MKLYAVTFASAWLALAMTPALLAQNPATPDAQTSGSPKDPAEAADYANARKVADPARRAEAMEAFVKRYPNSSAKVDAMEWAMAAYQQAGNFPKSFELAKGILELQPLSMRAMAAYVTLARDQADVDPQEAREMALQGFQNLPGWQKPWDMTPAEYTKSQEEMTAIFTSGIAYFAMVNRDLGTARQYYQQALLANPMSLEDTYSLGLVDVEMQPVDPAGFWYIARAIQLAKLAKSGGENFIASFGRLKYAEFHGSSRGWDEIVKRAANQTTMPDDFTVVEQAPPASPDNPEL